MDEARLALEYLRVVASWPVVIFVLAVVAIARFKDPIAALINRIAHIKIAGGTELSTPQPAPVTAADSVQGDKTTTTSAEEVPAADALVNERELSAVWEYHYLNYFLVPRTQAVLDWLAHRSPTSYANYDSWLHWFPPAERSAIIDALSAHHLIRIDDDQLMMTVTDKGREYLRWPCRPSRPASTGWP